MIQFVKKHCNIFLIIFFTLLYFGYILWENMMLPVSFIDGLWHYLYAHNISSGKIIYQDFYCVVPPLWFYILSIFTTIIDTYHAVSIANVVFYTLHFLIINLLIYYIQGKRNTSNFLYLFTFFIYLFLTINSSTVIYEYNRFSLLLFTISIFCIYNIIKKNKYLKCNIYCIGLLCCCMILTKQSIGIIYSIFYFLFLLYLNFKEKYFHSFYVIIYFISGFFTGIIPFIIWLFYYDNFIPFLNSCVLSLSTASNNFMSNTLEVISMCIIFIIVIGSYLYLYNKTKDLFLLYFILFTIPGLTFIYPVCNMAHFSCIILYFLIGYIYIFIQNKFQFNLKKHKDIVWFFLIILIFKILFTYFSALSSTYHCKNFAKDIYIPSYYAESLTDFELMINYINNHSDYEFYSPDVCYQFLMLECNREVPSDLSLFCIGSLGNHDPVELMTQYQSNTALYFIYTPFTMYQTPTDAISYIRSRYELIEVIGNSFEIYRPK